MQVFNTMDLCKEPSDKNSRFSLTWKSAPKKKKDEGGGAPDNEHNYRLEGPKRYNRNYNNM